MVSKPAGKESKAHDRAKKESIGSEKAYSTEHVDKLWRYLLIPHDELAVNQTLSAVVNRYGLGTSVRRNCARPLP